MAYSEGDRVVWKWGSGEAEGRIVKRYDKKITLKIKGAEITRHGSPDCPAYRIEQDDGDIVLKLHSEVDKV